MRFCLHAAVLCVLVTIGAPRASADDGSWVSERGYVPAEGALYAEDGSTDVVMEKEYLELRDVSLGSTRAVFQFHNTGDAAVIVECAFPIQFDFAARSITLDEKGNLVPDAAAGDAWDFGDVVPSRYAEGQQAAPEDKGFLNDVLASLGVLTDPWNAAAFRKEIEAAKLLKLFGFRILQDGKAVLVPTCVAEFGTPPGHLVLHFRHELAFPANGTSVVTVTYAMPTRSAVSAEPTSMRSPGITSEFTWKYILDTASSWKDTLGRIVLAVPPGFHPDLSEPWRYLGTAKGQLYYTAESWKPTENENLSLEWRRIAADYPEFWRRMTEPLDPGDLPPVESPAHLLGASTFLPEKADVFLPSGIWRNAPFDAGRLFDGLPETAWAVRTPKGGVGEYVRFSLDTDVGRLELVNGFQRSTVNFPDKDTWSYYGKNNRVKTLDILRDDGTRVARLAVADTREVQRFNVSLPAGIYRAVIVDIYPGSRWNDTCLGELTFIPGTAAGLDSLGRDPFFGPLLK
jgi:hypothetical protein